MNRNESKYVVLGRCVDGVNVRGYVLLDKVTKFKTLVSRGDVENLALNKQIENVTAQIYGGKVIIKGLNCKLNELPTYDEKGNRDIRKTKNQETQGELHLTARVIKGKNIVGYVVTLMNNGVATDKKCVKRETIMQMARNGLISNARVQMSNGKPVLRGVKCELAKLPSTSI